jgi:glucose/arabinose dehydrogenase
MGDDIPPGEMNRITGPGQDFGFPWYGGGHTRTVEYKNETPPANVVFSEVEQVAHAADLGLIFYTGTMFPKKYQGAIFSTQHGSWNRTVPVGARVMVTFVKEDGHVAGKSEPFAEGWNDNGYILVVRLTWRSCTMDRFSFRTISSERSIASGTTASNA